MIPRTVVIKFDTKNAAFVGADLRPECARILREIADKIEAGRGGDEYSDPVYDVNGNNCGRWTLGATGGRS